MQSCQGHVFKTIAESPVPLSKQNILQMLDFSLAAVSRSLTNLKDKGMVSGFHARYALTDSGRRYIDGDPNLTKLDKTIGSYSTLYDKPKPKFSGNDQDFLKLIIEEANKTSFGQEILKKAEVIYSSNSWMTLLAPWVAFFAIQAGLINSPTVGNGPTDADLDKLNKEIGQLINTYYEPSKEKYEEPDSVYK